MKRLAAIAVGALLLASTAQAVPQVGLGWDTGDPENAQEGFIVYRRLTTVETPTEVGRTDKLVTTFTDTGVQKNTVYCWTVRAYVGAEVSPPSNEVCALVLQNKIKLHIID